MKDNKGVIFNILMLILGVGIGFMIGVSFMDVDIDLSMDNNTLEASRNLINITDNINYDNTESLIRGCEIKCIDYRYYNIENNITFKDCSESCYNLITKRTFGEIKNV